MLTPPIALRLAPAPTTTIRYYWSGGQARDVQFGTQIGSAGLINLTLTGDNAAVGTITANYLVLDAGTQAILETMIISASFTIAR